MKLVRDKLLGKDDEVGLLQFVTEGKVKGELEDCWRESCEGTK